MSALKGPDFIGIGMERCATSWVFKMLAAHPDIWVPPLKELHYFDRVDKGGTWNRGRLIRHLVARTRQRFAHIRHFPERPEFYKNGVFEQALWDLGYFSGRKNKAWYKRLFHPRFTKGRVAGEFTPAYITAPDEVMHDMLRDFPEAKLILMIREPASRLRSGLFHHFKVEQGRRFCTVQDYEMEAYLGDEAVRYKSSPALIMDRWVPHVPAERFFIAAQTDFSAESISAFAREIYDFLGVDHSFMPQMDFAQPRVNAHTRKDDDQTLPVHIEVMINDFGVEEMARLQERYPDVAAIWSGDHAQDKTQAPTQGQTKDAARA